MLGPSLRSRPHISAPALMSKPCLKPATGLLQWPHHWADCALPLGPSSVWSSITSFPLFSLSFFSQPTGAGPVALSLSPPLHDRFGVPLVVDEAHGAHLSQHPSLPPSALHQGADIAIQSTHKVLIAPLHSSLHLLLARLREMLSFIPGSWVHDTVLDAPRPRSTHQPCPCLPGSSNSSGGRAAP